MRSRTKDARGVPCVTVADLPAAARYYRDVLGFDQIAMLGGIPPIVAIMRKSGALLVLQSPRAAHDVASSGPPWDAVLLVPDVPAAHREFTAHAVPNVGEVVDEIGWENFEIIDGSGKRICIGQSQPARRSRLTRPSRRILMQRQARLRALRSRWQEAPHLRAFRRFQADLRASGRSDIFYMFFSSGYLHWAARAAAFVPPEVDLVLIGSALSPDEQRWISDHIPRTFHHIGLPVDDLTAWEFLFDTARQDFGWIDTDCFVLDPSVFGDLTDLNGQTSMNGVWTWESGYQFRIANPHLLFVSAKAIAAVAGLGVRPSPGQYSWQGVERRSSGRPSYMTIPNKRERELLLQVLPPGWDGKAQLVFGDYYDGTEVFQLLARVAGYQMHPIRDLERRCGVTPSERSLRPEDWPQDMSDELFHLYGVSYYDSDEHGGQLQILFLSAELAVLDSVGIALPEQYRQRRADLVDKLSALGADAQGAGERFRQHLVHQRGMSQQAAEQVLPPGEPALTQPGQSTAPQAGAGPAGRG